MLKTLENMLNRLSNNAIGFIIGTIGSGKTFLSFLIAHMLSQRGYGIYYYNGGYCKSMCLDNFISECTDKRAVVIFDDFSFAIRTNSKEYYEFLNKLFRIRHLVNAEAVFVIFVAHYLRSLAVFIRSTNYKILTSITSSEVKMYANDYLFREGDLWDYYEYYVKMPNRFLVLAEFRGVSKIIDVTVDDDELKKQIEKMISQKTSRQFSTNVLGKKQETDYEDHEDPEFEKTLLETVLEQGKSKKYERDFERKLVMEAYQKLRGRYP